MDLPVFICNLERTILSPGGPKEIVYVTYVAEPRTLRGFCVGSHPSEGLRNRPGCVATKQAGGVCTVRDGVSTCRGSPALWAVGPLAPGALRLSTGAWVLHPGSTSIVRSGASLYLWLPQFSQLENGGVTTAMLLGCLEERTQLVLNKHSWWVLHVRQGPFQSSHSVL